MATMTKCVIQFNSNECDESNCTVRVSQVNDIRSFSKFQYIIERECVSLSLGWLSTAQRDHMPLWQANEVHKSRKGVNKFTKPARET